MMRNGLSIRRRLLLLLIVLLSAAWGATAYFTYRSARHEVAEVYDANLAQNARVIIALLRHEALEEREVQEKVQRLSAELSEDDLRRLPVLASMIAEYLKGETEVLSRHFEAGRAPGHRYESRIAIVGRQPDGSILLRSANSPDFGNSAPGYSYFGPREDAWRVFTMTDAESGLTLQVGERRELRNEMVRHITVSVTGSLVVLLPLLALLSWFAVGRGLNPLVKLAGSIERRSPDSLEPLDDARVPREAKPLADSLNRLFTRINEALENERRFTADAAHELRTPLAALKTQAQVAQRSVDPEQRAHALAQVVTGADRTIHLVEQLLALARSDAGQRKKEFVRVDLAEIAREVLRELAPGAGTRRIALELEGGGTVVSGDPDGLRLLLRNLVDNSIRYSNDGARVSVSILRADGRAVLRVTDNGPGIPPDQRTDMFKRFHRGFHAGATGSGLGLSIVQRIAELHGASIELGDGPNGRGLAVAIRFLLTDSRPSFR